MKSIGILGTGRMGVRLALMFANTGVKVFLGSREFARAARITKELKNSNIAPATYEGAVAQRVVIPAIFVRDGLFEILEPYRKLLEGAWKSIQGGLLLRRRLVSIRSRRQLLG